jgi:hypothetical protein
MNPNLFYGNQALTEFGFQKKSNIYKAMRSSDQLNLYLQDSIPLYQLTELYCGQ